MAKLETIGSLLFHIIVFIHDTYSLYWLKMIGGLKWTSIFYFTIWTLVAQSISALFISISDAMKLMGDGQKRRSEKDSKSQITNSSANWSCYKFILFHLSFVMSIATAIMFWSIYALEPTALVPKEFFYPLVLNHMHHTFPCLLSVIQLFIFAKTEINSFSLKMGVMKANEIGMVSVFFMGVSYSAGALSSKFIRGFLPYPFMNNLTKLQYGIFNMFGIVFSLVISNISNQVLYAVARVMRQPLASDKTR